MYKREQVYERFGFDTFVHDTTMHDHDMIVEALRRRDGDTAFVAMWNHIENVKTFLLASNALEEPAAAQPRKAPRRK